MKSFERKRAFCPSHPNAEPVCPGCVGARGGAAGTDAQNAARKINAQKAGRPKGSKSSGKLKPFRSKPATDPKVEVA